VSVFADLDLQVCFTHLKADPIIEGLNPSIGLPRSGNADTIAVPRFDLRPTRRVFDFDCGKFLRKRLLIRRVVNRTGLRRKIDLSFTGFGDRPV
jgi:hypothetical protein